MGLVVGAISSVTATRCESQQPRSPVLLLEPGMLTTDFVSKSGSTPSSTAFNFRFETRIPTGSRWFTPVLGASIAPYGTSATGGRTLNTPLIFAGNVFPLVSPRRTGAWATLDAPLLFYYSYGGGTESNDRLYGRDLFVQLALRLHVGQKLLRDLGPFWARLDAYAFLEQNLTPNADGTSPHPDRFNPVGLFGAVIPIGAPQGARRDR
jgi:hypothetical protein